MNYNKTFLEIEYNLSNVYNVNVSMGVYVNILFIVCNIFYFYYHNGKYL